MTPTMKRIAIGLWAAAAAAGVVAWSLPAKADPNIELGTLLCGTRNGINMLLASDIMLDCTFSKVGAADERYDGKLTLYGPNLGIEFTGGIAWVVVAPSSTPGGALEGDYYGITAKATVGVGGNANVLVGGIKRSIALQPASIGYQTGFNIAAGVSHLELIAR